MDQTTTKTADDALVNKIKVMEEELHILRSAQTECVSMADDIQKLYACIEEQRRHIASLAANADAADGGGVAPDPGVGVLTMLDALSRKHRAALAACNDSWHEKYAQLESASHACQAYVFNLQQQCYAQMEAETYRHQCEEYDLRQQNEELQRTLDATTQELMKNAQNEHTAVHFLQRNTHLQRELDMQLVCIEEQRRHLQSLRAAKSAKSDPEIGVATLLKQVKLNEFRYYQEKLANAATSATTEPEASSTWVAQMMAVAKTALTTTAATATRQRRDGGGLSPRVAAAVLRCLFRVRERKHETHFKTSLDGQKKLVTETLGRLRVARAEAEDREGFVLRLKESNAELAEKVDRLMEMNSGTLKSRDTLQMKLYTVILEKQRAETEHAETTEKLRVEETSHAATRAKLLSHDKRLEAVLAIVTPTTPKNKS